MECGAAESRTVNEKKQGEDKSHAYFIKVGGTKINLIERALALST